MQSNLVITDSTALSLDFNAGADDAVRFRLLDRDVALKATLKSKDVYVTKGMLKKSHIPKQAAIGIATQPLAGADILTYAEYKPILIDEEHLGYERTRILDIGTRFSFHRDCIVIAKLRENVFLQEPFYHAITTDTLRAVLKKYRTSHRCEGVFLLPVKKPGTSWRMVLATDTEAGRRAIAWYLIYGENPASKVYYYDRHNISLLLNTDAALSGDAERVKCGVCHIKYVSYQSKRLPVWTCSDS